MKFRAPFFFLFSIFTHNFVLRCLVRVISMGNHIKISLVYSGHIQVAESEIQSIRENLNGEKTRNLELEKELRDLKSSCTCYRASSVNSTYAEVFTNLDCSKELQSSIIVEVFYLHFVLDAPSHTSEAVCLSFQAYNLLIIIIVKL